MTALSLKIVNYRSPEYNSAVKLLEDSAVNFYLKNNWLVEGYYFDEHTIPHLKMRKAL